jgi:hypothetical protein
MQSGVIVRVFIASPGDVHLERDEACKVIHNWNAAHSIARSVIVEPVRVESHSRAVQGGHPQDLINGQLLERCDLLLAILWSRIGTPTAKDLSGTIQEIREFAGDKGANKVLLFFCDRDISNSADLDQVQAVRTFKERVRQEGLYVQYTEVSDFANLFRQQLEMAMNDLLGTDDFKSMSNTTERQPELLHPESCTILAVAALSEDGRIMLSRTRGGHCLSSNNILFNRPDNSRSESTWEGGLDQLETCGLVEALGMKREVFRVTRSGYESADQLWYVLVLRRMQSLQKSEYDYVDLVHFCKEPFLGVELPPNIGREKIDALATLGMVEAVKADGGTMAGRLNDRGRKAIRENVTVEFALPESNEDE